MIEIKNLGEFNSNILPKKSVDLTFDGIGNESINVKIYYNPHRDDYTISLYGKGKLLFTKCEKNKKKLYESSKKMLIKLGLKEKGEKVNKNIVFDEIENNIDEFEVGSFDMTVLLVYDYTNKKLVKKIIGLQQYFDVDFLGKKYSLDLETFGDFENEINEDSKDNYYIVQREDNYSVEFENGKQKVVVHIDMDEQFLELDRIYKERKENGYIH